jgi:hypothetical protein
MLGPNLPSPKHVLLCGQLFVYYIEDNIQNKLKMAAKIQGKRQHEKTVVPSTSSAFSNDYTEESEDKKSKGVSILQTNAELNIQNRQNQIFSEKINLPSIVINTE